jgi:CheY-specific phosphatase CheX
MGKELKAMRGQLRQIAKEILPEVLAGELFAALQKEQAARLTEIAKMVTTRLDQIETRSKDVQSYIMREMANSTAPKPNSQE